MKIVVGLGNPGKRYQDTRHNVGFGVVEALAQDHSGFQHRFQAEVAELVEDQQKVLLVKPQTFMNLSGQCVRELVDFYQLPLEDLLVVCDDLNLPLGRLRFRARGTHGGHKGLHDIQNHLGTNGYCRLRIGIGAPEEGETVDFVLSRFRPSEKPVMEEAVQKGVQGVLFWIHNGIDQAMNQYNG